MVNDPVKGVYRRPPCEMVLDNLDFSQTNVIDDPAISEEVEMKNEIISMSTKEYIIYPDVFTIKSATRTTQEITVQTWPE
jgi:hypothetical protein